MVIAGRSAGQLFTANIGGDSITVIERGRASPPSRWARAPRRSTSHPTARNCGPRTRATAASPSSMWPAKKVVATLALGTKRSNRLKFTPDGKRVLITDLDAGELLVLDAATRKEMQARQARQDARGNSDGEGRLARLRLRGRRRPDRHRGLEDAAGDRPPGRPAKARTAWPGRTGGNRAALSAAGLAGARGRQRTNEVRSRRARPLSQADVPALEEFRVLRWAAAVV